MRKRLRVIMLITAIVGSVSNFAPKATAQYVNPYTGNTFNNPVSSYLDTVIQGNIQTQNLLIQQSINRSILERSIQQQQGTNEQNTSTSEPSSSEEEPIAVDDSNPAAATSFKPVARSVVPQKIAAQIGKTPQEQQEYERDIDQLLKFYESYVQDSQWQLNDVAHAMSYYIGANYYVYTDGKEISDRKRSALYQTVSKFLVTNKDYLALNDAEKQEMYEAMAIQGSLPLLGYKSAVTEGNKEASQGFRQNAQQNLESLFGVPVAKVQFTDDGIVFQK